MNTIYVMNVSRILKILTTLFSITLIQNFSYAEQNNSIDTESSKETKNQAKEDSINSKLLDKLWDNRQSNEGGQEILQFIQNEINYQMILIFPGKFPDLFIFPEILA